MDTEFPCTLAGCDLTHTLATFSEVHPEDPLPTPGQLATAMIPRRSNLKVDLRVPLEDSEGGRTTTVTAEDAIAADQWDDRLWSRTYPGEAW